MKVFVSVCPPYNLCFRANCLFHLLYSLYFTQFPSIWDCTDTVLANFTLRVLFIPMQSTCLHQNCVNVCVQSYIVESIFAIVQDGFFATSDQPHKSVSRCICVYADAHCTSARWSDIVQRSTHSNMRNPSKCVCTCVRFYVCASKMVQKCRMVLMPLTK